MNLSRRAAGSNVTGTGVSYGIGPASRVDSITIVGHRAELVLVESLVLTLDFASGRLVTYSGQLVGANQLKGTWTEANQSHSVGSIGNSISRQWRHSDRSWFVLSPRVPIWPPK